MKKFRKLTAVLLALLMLVAYMPVMTSAAETGTIVGDTTLFAPPIGTYSKVKYVLKDANGEVVPDAKVVMAYAHPGVTVEGDCLVLNGSTIKSGNFRMHMESADGSIVTADSSMAVSEKRIFLDAEYGAVNADPVSASRPYVLNSGEPAASGSLFQSYYYKEALPSDTSYVVIKQESSGNKFFYADDDAYVRFKPDWAGISNASAQTMTFQTKIKYHGDYVSGSSFNYIGVGELTWLKYTVGNASHTDKEILSRSLADGSAAASVSAYAGSGVALTSAWADVRVEFDFRNKVYTVYVNNEAVFKDYKMPSSITKTYFGAQVDLYTCFDDVAIYSGVPYTPELPYEIDGVSTIYLPEGKAAAVPFALKNKEDGAVVTDAVYSVSGTGLEILPDGKLIVNSNTPAGTYVISAYSASNTLGLVASKAVTVKAEKWYYDFESYEIGANVAHSGSAGTAPKPGQVSPVWAAVGTVRGETDADGNVINKYFGFPDDWVLGNSSMYHRMSYMDNYFKGVTTFEFDLIINDQTDGWHNVMGIVNSAGNRIVSLTYNNKNLRHSIKEDGTSYDSSTGKYFELGKGTHNIRVEMGYETYSIWVNGKLWVDSWTNAASTKGYIRELTWYSLVDNLMFYNGSQYYLAPSTTTTNLKVPGAGESTYEFSSVYSDGGEVSKELTYSLDKEYEGVTIEGNVLTVADTAKMVPVTVNVTDGFTSGSVRLKTSKKYIVVNGVEYTEGSEVITEDGTYKIEAAIGDSDRVNYYNMYIAHYEGDKLVSVKHGYQRDNKAMDISAKLEDTFTADGEAKVFIWTHTLIPVEAVKVIK